MEARKKTSEGKQVATPLIVNLEDLKKSKEKCRRFDLSGFEVEIPRKVQPAALSSARVKEGWIEVRLLKKGDLEITGEFSFEVKMQCSRCLEEFVFRKRVSIFNFLIERSKVEFAPEMELSSDDLIVDFYEGEEVDIFPVFRDALILAIPISPVCEPDCKGLCPYCGFNLNKGPHECKMKPVFSPFASLAELKGMFPAGGKRKKER